jgi:hypothetical protein
MKNKNLKEDYLHDCSLFPVYVIKVPFLELICLSKGEVGKKEHALLAPCELETSLFARLY